MITNFITGIIWTVVITIDILEKAKQENCTFKNIFECGLVVFVFSECTLIVLTTIFALILSLFNSIIPAMPLFILTAIFLIIVCFMLVYKGIPELIHIIKKLHLKLLDGVEI